MNINSSIDLTKTAIALLATATISVIGGCEGLGTRPAPTSFSGVRPVLESNCVHCHGHERLKQMPAFADTRELSRLIGPANWIVPGHPERSRFLLVVTLADEQPGAMPPTGHKLAKSDIEALRDWIATGALLPTGGVQSLAPRGSGPRSR